MKRIKETLKNLLISQEARDPEYLKLVFQNDQNFMNYQYSVGTLGQSIYNNITLCYRHYERVQVLLNISEGLDEILDVGGGFGDIALELSNNNKSVVLLDYDKTRLLLAKYRFKHFSCEGIFIRGDAHNLPFRDNSFDVAFSNQVIEHVCGPEKIVLEKIRVSKEKAIVICANNLMSLPGANFVYFKLLTRKPIEIVPDLGGYDDLLYLNCQFIPLNSIISIFFMKIVIKIPLLQKMFAGNIVKIYNKNRLKN